MFFQTRWWNFAKDLLRLFAARACRNKHQKRNEDKYQLSMDAAAKTHLPVLCVRRGYADAGGFWLTAYLIAKCIARPQAISIEHLGTNPRDLPVQNR